jgi:hypothetical protein
MVATIEPLTVVASTTPLAVTRTSPFTVSPASAAIDSALTEPDRTAHEPHALGTETSKSTSTSLLSLSLWP